MLDLMPSLKDWQPVVDGVRCAVATVVGAAGSVPRPLGTSMVVAETGEVLGSLSGGCVEGAVVAAALDVMADGGTRREFFGYSDADAFAVGLTCGGELEVHIEPLGSAVWMGAAEPMGAAGGSGLGRLEVPAGSGAGTALALIRRVDAGGAGAVVVQDPAHWRAEASADLAALLGPAAAGAGALVQAAAQLEPLLRGGRNGLVRFAPPEGCLSGTGVPPHPGPEPITLLVESRLPAPRMLVFGANDFGAALVPAARLLGYHVTLCDARPAFTSQERFAAADQVVTAWPHQYLAAEAAAGRLDPRTVVCVLTHDPKFDIPLLQAALGLDLAYVGAMGSRRSHAQRLESLHAAGVTPADTGRLHSPIGLDLGAVTPAEVAVSITAELVASRNRTASGQPLKHGSGPIHQRAGRPHPAGGPRTAVPVPAAPPAAAPHHRSFHHAAAGRPAPPALTPQHQEMPWT
ncbi:XdhC family protein [Arthrobacter sp. EPSL27]|uniref:XdhC family protein n=1 Tax=Arthrobacter sp. EPSL27 TaxID=1745378 RepID=UPI0009EC4A93|nr:XdhC/CoxI family protein [Arthrobacter sp. EPSL27]